MLIYNTYSDLLVAISRNIMKHLPISIAESNVRFNIGNLSFQLNNTHTGYELPHLIVNHTSIDPWQEQPTAFQNVMGRGTTFEQVAVYNESNGFQLNCLFGYKIVNIEVILNVESQHKAIQCNDTILNTYPIGKKLHHLEFTHFVNLDPSVLHSNYINPNKDIIHNLYVKYSPEEGVSSYYFMNTSKPLFEMNSIALDLSDNNAETYTLQMGFSALYQVPIRMDSPNLTNFIDPLTQYSNALDTINDGINDNNNDGGGAGGDGGDGDGADTTGGNPLIDHLYNDGPIQDSPIDDSDIVDIITLLSDNGNNVLGDPIASNSDNRNLQSIVRFGKSIPTKQSLLLYILDSNNNETYDVLVHISNPSNAISTYNVVGPHPSEYRATNVDSLDNADYGVIDVSVDTVIDEYFATTEFNTLLVKVKLYVITDLTQNKIRLALKSYAMNGDVKLVEIDDSIDNYDNIITDQNEIEAWVAGELYSHPVNQRFTFKLVSPINIGIISPSSLTFKPSDPAYSMLANTYTHANSVYNDNVKISKSNTDVYIKNYDHVKLYSNRHIEFKNNIGVAVDGCWLDLNKSRYRNNQAIPPMLTEMIDLDLTSTHSESRSLSSNDNVLIIETEYDTNIETIDPATPSRLSLIHRLHTDGSVFNTHLKVLAPAPAITIVIVGLVNRVNPINDDQFDTLVIDDAGTLVDLPMIDNITGTNLTPLVIQPNRSKIITFQYDGKMYDVTVTSVLAQLASLVYSSIEYTLPCVFGSYSNLVFIHDQDLHNSIIESITIQIEEADTRQILSSFGVFDISQYTYIHRHLLYTYDATYDDVADKYAVKVPVTDIFDLNDYSKYSWVIYVLNSKGDTIRLDSTSLDTSPNSPSIITLQNQISIDYAASQLDSSSNNELFLMFRMSTNVFFKAFSDISSTNPAIFLLTI